MGRAERILAQSDSRPDAMVESHGLGPRRRQSASAYDESAAALLGSAQSLIAESLEKLTQDVFTNLPEATILQGWDASALRCLHGRLVEHLRQLLTPQASQEDIVERARSVGEIHTLVGVTSASLTQAVSHYRSILHDVLARSPHDPIERTRLMQIVEARLQDDLQIQLDSQSQIITRYLNAIMQALPAIGTRWVDARRENLQALAALPGILAVALLRLQGSGIFEVEDSAGPNAAALAANFQNPDLALLVDADSPQGHSLTAQAWRDMRILSSADYRSDPRYAHWHERGAALSIRSTLSIPVSGEAGQVAAVLSLYGAHINQFEPPLMRQFAHGLQSRWNQILRHANAPLQAITQAQAATLRQRLFAGGLRMYAQPIVDLESAGEFHAEALARLEMPDGTVLSPAAFLPILGESDLNHLFRLSLGIALDHLLFWERAGVRSSIAVNMPPSALQEEGCVGGIEHALRARGIVPSRLTLEFLEAPDIDVSRQSAAIGRLKRLGVCIAIDDLGSGYSSLQRMASLPFDIIKVDQSIVRQIYKNPLGILSMLDMFVRMGRDLDLLVVVEGLEDEGMIEAARILGVQMMQGYGLGRPMPVEEFIVWAERYRQPPQDSAIRTALGVLAYCWTHMRRPLNAFQRDEAIVMLLDLCERERLVAVVDFLRSRSLRAMPREVFLQLADRVRLDDLHATP